MRIRSHGCLLAAVAVLPLSCASLAQAQAPTVLDRVYTDAQAARGQSAYSGNCARCHGPGLDGSGTAPVLHGTLFLDAWREDYLSSLFQHIQTRMPPNAVGTLPEGQYVDIVAYILAVNQFPAGQRELTRTDLDTTVLVGPDGPKPLPANATARVVGCLAHSGDAWTLTHSTTPSRVRNGSETDPAELAKSSRSPLGTLGFRLPNLDEDHKESELLPHVGDKVQVKGVVNGQGASARIYVLSFETLGHTCDP